MTEGGRSPRSEVTEAPPRPVSDSTLHSVFDDIDSNHDGVLTVADIKVPTYSICQRVAGWASEREKPAD